MEAKHRSYGNEACLESNPVIQVIPAQKFLRIHLNGSYDKFDTAIRMGILKFFSHTIRVEYSRESRGTQSSNARIKRNEMFLLEKKLLLPKYKSNEDQQCTLLIRQANSLTENLFQRVREKLLLTSYHPILNEIELITTEKNLCVQTVYIDGQNSIPRILDSMDQFLESNLYEHADRYFCVMSLDIDQNPSHSNEKRILRCTIRREVKPALI